MTVVSTSNQDVPLWLKNSSKMKVVPKSGTLPGRQWTSFLDVLATSKYVVTTKGLCPQCVALYVLYVWPGRLLYVLTTCYLQDNPDTHTHTHTHTLNNHATSLSSPLMHKRGCIKTIQSVRRNQSKNDPITGLVRPGHLYNVLTTYPLNLEIN